MNEFHSLQMEKDDPRSWHLRQTELLENAKQKAQWLKPLLDGDGDPHCKIMITMVKTSPDAEPFRQQS